MVLATYFYWDLPVVSEVHCGWNCTNLDRDIPMCVLFTLVHYKGNVFQWYRKDYCFVSSSTYLELMFCFLGRKFELGIMECKIYLSKQETLISDLYTRKKNQVEI